ncbi:VIT1/CCC1 transporter family protein [Actinomycetospora cinnamomea]|uniref:VIT1/CCC1 family predicted Fe2+/Mn2+ transporter n=1 Tax=Actinomycetospora cinnamomea TaxID=663609 RepID=A0A2U1FF65_9PSEU|nr:VIT1/CCC1 family protein [Actinomycetospora cinnamomea]PVZ10865.1 VIT1/CCC1 family predicted Fe2+/Mn2+ transporter [Actinomycetospora cinnamomea]
MSGSEEITRRRRKRLADECAEARVYRDLAARRSSADEREILLGLAEAEERHAAHWQALLGDEAGPAPRGDVRLRLLALLARNFGSVFVLALAQRAERRASRDAADDVDTTPAMVADERVHEEVVRGLAARGREQTSGTFRAAVFGANDGLVSNLALVIGVSGGGVAASTVLLTGLAGLLAGALSMGAGEYISVRSQRELLEASAPDPASRRIVPDLDIEANELALVYRARGMSTEDAQRQAEAVLRGAEARPDPTPDPRHEVVGTGVGAALSSFAFFASGAAVPVLPFLVGLEGLPALVTAMVLVGLGLLLTGATVGILSGGPPLRRGLRQLGIGAGAAALTYLLGLLVGGTIG